MAKDKKSFILYTDLISVFEQLPDDIAGKLIKIVFQYVNDRDPIIEDLLLKIAFEPLKLQLKRDLKEWEVEKIQRSEAGKKGMESRWKKHNEEKELITKDNTVISVITDDNTLLHPITNITDNVNVSVNDIVIVKEKREERKLKFADTLKPFLSIYGKDMLNDFYKYWVEPNKSQTKFKQELEKTWDLERRLEVWARRDKTFANSQPTEKTYKRLYENKE